MLQGDCAVHTPMKMLPLPWPKKPPAERMAPGGRGEGWRRRKGGGMEEEEGGKVGGGREGGVLQTCNASYQL